MVVDAEALLPELMAANEADGPYFKIEDDPRVTRVGRLLRRLSIDELPQLFNVLFGDMSLVGPRPFLPAEMEADPEFFEWRLPFMPGITGLWQVAGPVVAAACRRAPDGSRLRRALASRSRPSHPDANRERCVAGAIAAHP